MIWTLLACSIFSHNFSLIAFWRNTVISIVWKNKKVITFLTFSCLSQFFSILACNIITLFLVICD
jgi:hypothetical protein